jgi:hypothetical protein
MQKLIVIGLLFVGTASGAGVREDGNWWLGMSEPMQVGYVQGYYGGRLDALRHCNASVLITEKLKDVDRDAFSKFACNDSRRDTSASVGQVVDGLKSFFGESRNKRILMSHALIVVTARVNGETDEAVAEKVEYYRKLDGEAT